MGYMENYFAVVNAVKARLETVSEVKQIVFGEKDKIAQLQFPCLFIIPGPDNITDETSEEFRHEYNFDLVLVLKDYDIEVGLQKVIEIGGKCYDAVMADRQLSGTALWASINTFDPGYGSEKSGMVLHWVSIGLTVVKVTY